MSPKSRLPLVFLFMLAMVFLVGTVPRCCSSLMDEEQETRFMFSVSLGQFDWETKTIEAPIDVWFENLPDSFKDEKGEYVPSSITVSFEQWHNRGEVFLYPMKEESKIIYRGSLPTNRFHFRGLTELYPFDSYMLNITFRFPSFGIVNENNTITKPENLVGGFDLREQPGAGDKPFNMTYGLGEAGEEAILSFRVYLSRSASSTTLIMQVLGICYLLVGSLPLIGPEKLEQRLSICLSLFIFAVTLTFTIPIPTLNRATLAENLIYILLTGAGAFSVVSVVEKALLEAKLKLAASRFLIEGLVVLFLVMTLRNALAGLISSELAAEYPWASFPPELLFLLSVTLLFGYVSVTLASTLGFAWKKLARKTDSAKAAPA